MEDLRTAIGAFVAERHWEQSHSPKNLAMALSVEAAEIVEHFQWLTEQQSENLAPEKLAEVREEIGDVMDELDPSTTVLQPVPNDHCALKVALVDHQNN